MRPSGSIVLLATHNLLFGAFMLALPMVRAAWAPTEAERAGQSAWEYLMFDSMLQAHPMFWQIKKVVALLSSVEWMVLIVSTVGLLRMKSWGVYLTIGSALYGIVAALMVLAGVYFISMVPDAAGFGAPGARESFDGTSIRVTARIVFFTSNLPLFLQLFDSIWLLHFVVRSRVLGAMPKPAA